MSFSVDVVTVFYMYISPSWVKRIYSEVQYSTRCNDSINVGLRPRTVAVLFELR